MNRLTFQVIGLLATIIASPFLWASAGAQDASTSSTATGQIQINAGGEFNVTLCESVDFGTAEVTSARGDVKRDRTKVCYFDSWPVRKAFTVTLSASDFIAVEPASGAVIPASNLSIYRTSAPLRTQFAGCPVLEPFADDIGLIYATGNPDMAVRLTSGTNASYTWGDHSLAEKQVVGRGEKGRGTEAGCTSQFGDVQAVISLDLAIPAGQPPAMYETILTLEVTFDEP